VVNAAAVPAFVNAVNAAGNKLTGAGASVAPTVAGARAAVLSYGRNPDPKLDFQLVDAGLLAASLNDPAQLAPVLAAVNAAVAYKVVGPGLSGGTGVSLYFPPDSSTYRTSYGNVAVTTGWNKFLNSYYANGAAAGGASRAFFGTEGTTQTTADSELTEQGVFLTVPFRVDDPSTLTGVRIRYGVQGDDGAPVLTGEDTGAFTQSSEGVAGGAWDLSELVVSDGDVSVPVYRKVVVDPVANQLTFTAPFAYYPDKNDQSQVTTVIGNVTVDLESGKAQRAYFEIKQDPTEIGNDGNGAELATSGVVLNPAGALVPLVARIDPAGALQFVKITDTSLVPTGGGILKADPSALTFRIRPVTSGTPIYADLAISQLGGFLSTASMTDQVP
jgi:hypothetical protein